MIMDTPLRGGAKKMRKQKETKKYHCHYCDYKFSQLVGIAEVDSKHKNCSSQVCCRRCGNFLKTWGDK